MLVRVRAQPRARRNAVLGVSPGIDGPRLRVAVAAVPEDGRANRAVSALLAEALGVAASAVQVSAGAASREKILAAAGDAVLLGPRLERLA